MAALRTALVAALLMVPVGLWACDDAGPAADGDGAAEPIVVGSKIDTEGALLANIIALSLQDAGMPVRARPGVGQTQVVRKALLSEEIDVYPEYTGNGAVFFPQAPSDVWGDRQEGYRTVRELDAERNDVVWLQSAPANNTWAIAVPRRLAEREDLRTLEDFARYVNAGGRVKLAGSEEFVTSPAALDAIERAYGFELEDDQLVTFGGGNTTQTEKAAAEGTDDVNAAMAYGTDGALAALDLVVLEDPRGAQPVYAPAPTVRGEVYRAHPRMADVLNPVFATLDTGTLQRLNQRIVVEGARPEQVARDYLDQLDERTP